MEKDKQEFKTSELIGHIRNVAEAIETLGEAFAYGRSLWQDLIESDEILEAWRRAEIRHREVKALRLKKYTLGLTWSEQRRLQG